MIRARPTRARRSGRDNMYEPVQAPENWLPEGSKVNGRGDNYAETGADPPLLRAYFSRSKERMRISILFVSLFVSFSTKKLSRLAKPGRTSDTTPS